MTTEKELPVESERTFARSLLPWVVLLAGLGLYVITLNRWVTLMSIGQVAQLAGWDFQPVFLKPLLFAVTQPIKWLPLHWQPLALNLFSAVCAALTLALLARSVALLPQDRTRDQRVREPHELGLLSLRSAWVPPLVAILAFGLQSDFWQHAIGGSEEILDLLLFAYVVRCVLEYRVSERDSWLVRMSFVYGLAVTNNWAMIGLFPLTLSGVVWVKGRGFLEGTFFLKMLGAGLAGLLLYFLLPILALQYDYESLSFLTALRINLGRQWQFLTFSGFRLPFFLLSLASLLPMLLVFIRWPSSVGDVSPLGNILSNFLYRAAHVGFFVVCLAALYVPDFLAAQFENLIPFLTLRYLSALCVGYFAGYLLLVFGVPASKSWHRPNAISQALEKAVVAAVWLSLLAVPALFIQRNLPKIRLANRPVLKDFAAHLAQSLPSEKAAVVSDEPVRLWLLAAHYAQQKVPMPYLALNSSAAQFHLYHTYLNSRHPELWPPLPKGPDGKPIPEPVSPLYLINRLADLSQKLPIYYLHPSFGYYFEHFYARPSGLALELRPYPPKAIVDPPLTDPDTSRNLTFWQNLAPELAALAALPNKNPQEIAFVLGAYSRSLNQWGVTLQRHNHPKEAGMAFNQAVKLNPDNVVAIVNRAYNANLQKGSKAPAIVDKETENKIRMYRSKDALLGANGPFDEPNYVFVLGKIYMDNGLHRQATHAFMRARQLMTNAVDAELMLGQVYLKAGLADEALGLARELRASNRPEWQHPLNRIELVRIEALAQFARNAPDAAESVLRAVLESAPEDPATLAVVAHVYLVQKMHTNALQIIDRQLQLEPDNVGALLNKSVALMELRQYQPAANTLSILLEKKPDNRPGRLNRAIAYLQLEQLDAARKDYEFLRRSNPKYFAVHFGLAEIAYRKKEYRAAIRHYEDYLKFAPDGTQERKNVEARLKQLKAS